jgi:hypothetical protein
LWQHHHVLMHHAYTNVDGDDPDITGEIVRFHSLTRWHGHHKWQVRVLCRGSHLALRGDLVVLIAGHVHVGASSAAGAAVALQRDHGPGPHEPRWTAHLQGSPMRGDEDASATCRRRMRARYRVNGLCQPVFWSDSARVCHGYMLVSCLCRTASLMRTKSVELQKMCSRRRCKQRRCIDMLLRPRLHANSRPPSTPDAELTAESWRAGTGGGTEGGQRCRRRD